MAMQIRKLVKSGYASLVVAVPKEWIKKNRLKAGDLVYIEDESNRLKLSTELKEEPHERKEAVINVDGKDIHTIMNEIASAYMNNYFYIIVKGRELDKVSKTVKKCIQDMVALELVEESGEKIIARDFVNIADVDIKLLIRRMDNVVRSMMLDAKTALKNPGIVASIADRDIELNKLSFFVFKTLKAAYKDKKVQQHLNLEDLDILRYWELNIHIEKVGDRVKNIASIMPKLSINHRKKCIEIFIELEGLYIAVMKSLYETSIPQADLVSRRRHVLMKDIENYMKKNNDSGFAQMSINAFNMIGNINDISRLVRYVN